MRTLLPVPICDRSRLVLRARKQIWPGGRTGQECAFARRVRISGRDEESGEHFGAELYLPHGGRGYGSSPASPRDAAIGDAALRNLENRDPFDECSGLRAWQRALDAHYAKG